MENRAALINELNILQSLFKNSPAATMVVDKHNTIQLVNHQFEQITGFSHQELEG